MLMVKLEIQSEFTQIAYVGGENGRLSCGPGLRSWIVTVINAARAAENNPVYRFFSVDVIWGCVSKIEGSQRVQSPRHPFDGVRPYCYHRPQPSLNKEKREALGGHKGHS
jgi:hypothetical protein